MYTCGLNISSLKILKSTSRNLRYPLRSRGYIFRYTQISVRFNRLINLQNVLRSFKSEYTNLEENSNYPTVGIF